MKPPRYPGKPCGYPGKLVQYPGKRVQFPGNPSNIPGNLYNIPGNSSNIPGGNKLQFPGGRSQTLGADSSPAGWGWKVELTGRVLDGTSAERWYFLQRIESTTTLSSVLGGERTTTEVVNENISGPEFLENQVSGNTRYALDSPGFKRVNNFTVRSLMNFTTWFTDGANYCQATWSVSVDVRNGVLVGATFR
jgi:hypothetical protein